MAIYTDPNKPTELLESWTFTFTYNTDKHGTTHIGLDFARQGDPNSPNPSPRPKSSYSQTDIERHAGKLLRA